jgi:sensor c-di-GMP phosphodiesterase-like protein
MRNHPNFRLNVNITATDLADPTFLPSLEASLAAAGIHPHSLALELTESSTANRPVVHQTIQALQSRGHSVQIDDFGTGHSSLAYLKDLSVDTIKIDRAFTQAIGTEAVTASILPQILSMADTLNLQVIVEGVETQEQARYFAGSGTGRRLRAQGWLYSRPMPAHQLITLMAQERSAAQPQLTTSDPATIHAGTCDAS